MNSEELIITNDRMLFPKTRKPSVEVITDDTLVTNIWEEGKGNIISVKNTILKR